jgi:hypothetical protein
VAGGGGDEQRAPRAVQAHNRQRIGAGFAALARLCLGLDRGGLFGRQEVQQAVAGQPAGRYAEDLLRGRVNEDKALLRVNEADAFAEVVYDEMVKPPYPRSQAS